MPDGKRAVDAVVDSFKRLVKSDDDAARRALYRSLLAPIGPEDVDQILERIASRGFDRAAVRDRARWMLEVSAHAAPAKVGLAILGISGRPEDTDLLVLFARHDEFTLYSAVAASNLLPDPVDVWWKMAQNVHGWGKVQLVALIVWLHVARRHSLVGRRRRINLGRQPPFRSPTRCLS
jgi:hypothetical protein